MSPSRGHGSRHGRRPQERRRRVGLTEASQERRCPFQTERQMREPAVRSASVPLLVLNNLERTRGRDGTERIAFLTNAGAVTGRLHWADADAAVLWVFGAGGELDGPAGGVYPRLAGQFRIRGVTSLELAYRRPGRLDDWAELDLGTVGPDGRGGRAARDRLADAPGKAPGRARR